MNAYELLTLAVEAAGNKKAENIVSLNMQQISDIADYFVVCHGNNERQVQAIAKAVKDNAEEHGINVKRMEGYQEAKWILVDLTDVVVHVFLRDERLHYNLEKLYHDAEMYLYEEVVKA
ncbi:MULTISPECIES: ribosome silencing factor [Staphylococcus]|uniref:Ribosomal silencing factor RsfS n=1 Tax=Staphylococcus chromogenes TaxID=46126 RepID=A0AAE5T0K9_STACR|nr:MULTISPECIES: ribosome silencing factor [Staphylococcus]MBP0045720.1 ribosome silencing factor [Staphylococcus chromogenes]MBV5137102.1 ribosome silencing factor [Staphylococcus chromogenes]MBV5190569.1 ribosome silencing factor [Staphylococcus chromogenes]MBW3132034.1 ribosome silencing factor [Staphylococcus chromogenes]MBW6089649.1 ribosome silencing factor [Staphylococcus chromogenes]